MIRETLTELILDFYERPRPSLRPREIVMQELPRNASILVGMRRTGKTFCVYQAIEKLVSDGIPLHRILYLNLDDDRLDGMTLAALSSIPEIFYALHPENRDYPCYFFLDEIQDVDKWEVFIRRLLDTENLKVILTGSSSKLLSQEIASVMRGRSVETEIFPLSFREFLRFHGIFQEIPRLLSSRSKSKILNAIQQYFQIGGFPEVQACSSELWAMKLQGYVNEVLFRDVVERYSVTNIPSLRYIVQKVFHNPGGKLSANQLYHELKSNGLGADREKISFYLECLCHAYLFYAVQLHTDSLAQRQVNPPKFYLADLGLIRALNTKQSADNGFLLENLVFLHLRRKGYEIEYLITRDGFEVDFIAYHKFDRDYHLYQVSYQLQSPGTLERELRALQSAAYYLKAAETTIVTWDTEAELAEGIRAMPIWKFLLEL